jgi:hypothetical protein
LSEESTDLSAGNELEYPKMKQELSSEEERTA